MCKCSYVGYKGVILGSYYTALAAEQCIVIGPVCGWVCGLMYLFVYLWVCYHDNSKWHISILTKLGL